MRWILITVFAITLIAVAILTGLAGSQGGLLEAQGAETAAADRTLLGLHVFPEFNTKISSADRAWIKNQKVEVPWVLIETAPGVYDFSYIDALLNRILGGGSESLLFLLNGPIPAWERDPQYGSMANMAPPLNLNDWYRFCSKVAERYASVVDYYEIWNEPGWDRDSLVSGLGVYHFGGQVETDYLPLLQLGYAAIKEKDPTAAVLCGALMYNLIDDPDTGQQNYALLFDDVNRPGQDISMKIDADKPIVADRSVSSNDKGAWNGGHDTAGIAPPRTKWNFARGSARPGFNTWLCLENAQSTDANVGIDYLCGDGNNVHKDVTVGAESNLTIAVNETALGIGQSNSTHGDVSIKVTSSQPIVAGCPTYFDYNNAEAGGQEVIGGFAPQTTWYFAAGRAGFSIQKSLIQEQVSLQNANPDLAIATITFMMAKGEQFSRQVLLAGSSTTTLNINRLIGFQGSCDEVAVHPYRSPKFWGPFYTNVVNTLRGLGDNQEVVVSEVGWPSHADRSAGFSEQYQADAIGKLGIGGLFDAGCKKIWIFRDYDEDPGTSWDGNYYGLFNSVRRPHPAWSSYVSWQQQLPHYAPLPPSFP